MWVKFVDPMPEGPARNVINNCRVEAALVHARALSQFLMPKPGEYLHHSHYKPWSGNVTSPAGTNVTGRIFGAVSNHLAHPSLGSKGPEPLPGAWPLPELATALMGGLASFVFDSDEVTDTYDPAWFTPSPVGTYLTFGQYPFPPTEVSDHPEVGALTTALQTYIAEIATRGQERFFPRPQV
jgi:hypothetical protein